MYRTVEKILLEFDPELGNLLPALRKISASFGYVNENEARRVANYFSVNLTKVYETASFYDLLPTKKEPPLKVKICSGGNCTVDNAFKVLHATERYLGVKAGDDFNPHKKIEIVSCLGRCGEGPIVIINDKIFTKVMPNKIEDIFKGFL